MTEKKTMGIRILILALFLTGIIHSKYSSAEETTAVVSEPAPSSETEVFPPSYMQGMTLAREGQLAEAIPLLEQAFKEKNDSMRIAADYIVVLSWNNQWTKAIEIYEKFPLNELFPDYVRPQIAKAYRMAGKIDKAELHYETYLRYHPEDTDAFEGLISCFFDAQDWIKARYQLENRLLNSPDKNNIRWKSLLLKVYLSQSDWDKFFTLLAEVKGDLKKSDDSPSTVEIKKELAEHEEKIADQAIQAGQQGRPQQALDLIEKLQASGYNPVSLQLDKIVIQVWNKQYSQALSDYEKIPGSVKKPDFVLKAVAQGYEAVEDFGQALRTYQELLPLAGSESKDISSKMLELSIRVKDYPAAEKLISLLLDQNPNDASLKLKHLEILLGEQKIREALRVLDSVPLSPSESQNAEDLVEDASERFSQKQWQEIESILSAIKPEIGFNAVEAKLYLISWVKARSNEKQKSIALDYFLKQSDRYSVPLKIEIAGLALSQDQIQTAEKIYTEILAIDPENIPGLIGLARCHMARKDYAQAQSCAEKILTRNPIHEEGLFLQGEIFEEQKLFLDAINIYERILKEHPEKQAALNLKIRSLMELGANSLAFDILEQREKETVDPVLYERSIGDAAMHQINWKEPMQAMQTVDKKYPSYRIQNQSATMGNWVNQKARALEQTLDLFESTDSDEPPLGPTVVPTGIKDQPPDTLAAFIHEVIRNKLIDQALAAEPPQQPSSSEEIKSPTTEVSTNGLSNPEDLRRRWDRMLALRDMLLMDQVIEEYLFFSEKSITLPPWILQAVGDAYLYERRPQEALTLYRLALYEDPQNYMTRLSIYDTLVELGRFNEAQDVLTTLDKDNPAQVIERGILRDNDRKVEIAYNQAWLYLYQDRLRDAERYLKEVADPASFNTNLRTAAAHTHFWRGWPRRALEDFKIIETMDPENVAAGNGQSLVLDSLGYHEEARERNKKLLQKYPKNKHLQRTQRQFAIDEMRTLIVDGALTVEHPGSDETLFSIRGEQPFKYRHLLFAEILRRETSQVGDNDILNRLYLGYQWKAKPTWQLTASVSQEYDTGDNFGWFTEAVHTPNDFWTLGLSYDSHTIDIPVRSRSSGVDATEAAFSATYRQSESFNTSIRTALKEFTDLNDNWEFTWKTDTALTTRAYWKTRLLTEFSSTVNSKTDVDYYSPESVYNAYLIPMVEHLWFRRYERSLVDRLYIGLGQQWQKGFDAKDVGYFRYEQDYNFSDTFSWLIGLIYSQKNYDGNYDNVFNLYSTLRKKF